MGRADRQGGVVSVPVGPPQSGVAQAEARQRRKSSSCAGGPSRATRDRASARCCSAPTTTAARTAADLRRPHRHGVRPEGARSRLEAPGHARDPRVPVLRPASRPTSRRTGCGRSWSRRCGSPSGPPTGKLRHPVYLGLRDDKPASRGDAARRTASRSRRPTRTTRRQAARSGQPASAKAPARCRTATARPRSQSIDAVISQLHALEDARKDGTIDLPAGERLRRHQPCQGLLARAGKRTKGDLLRYYAQVSHLILPAVADRPLVMKRFPNGIDKPAFYQQRSRIEQPPAGVRIETLPDDVEPISEPDARRFVGGNLITLLYMTQIAAISQDPWFSRVQSPLDADYVALDLDPGDGTPFSRVARRRALGSRRAGRRFACRACRRRRGRAGCTSTSRCRRTRRTNRACCSARSSRR